MVQATHQGAADDAVIIDERSLAFVGRWRGLISTTNWEKGRIIHEWREALKASGAPAQEFSDEAWSRRVGQVSGQHAGRLRRVYERFGDVRQSYSGLYWSHFQAALDWSDGEMWLEGAMQSEWTVSEMRARRWETLGEARNGNPPDNEVVEAEFDEDADPAASPEMAEVRDPASPSMDRAASNMAARDRSRRDDDEATDEPVDDNRGFPFDADAAGHPATSPHAPVRPFEHMPELPDDLADAFEAFKLAILRHKLAGWREVSREGILQCLDALKQLALTPTDE